MNRTKSKPLLKQKASLKGSNYKSNCSIDRLNNGKVQSPEPESVQQILLVG